MTIEQTATFSVSDLKAFGVECSTCHTMIVIPLGGDVKVDESLYCPRCKQDGSEILWTAEASDADKKLAAALIDVSKQTKTKIRMMAALGAGSR